MSEHDPRLSSQEFGEELGQVLSFRKSFLDAQAEETALFKQFDSPEFNNQLWQQSYYEINMDTPAKRMLWEAESAIKSFDTDINDDKYGYRFNYFDATTFLPLVVEGYSLVSPSEGFRLLSQMPDDIVKVEALARFSRVDESFLIRARQQGHQHYDWRYDGLFSVACFGNDDETLNLIFENVTSKDPDRDHAWMDIDMLVKLATLGHMGALLSLKQRLPQYDRDGDGSSAYRIENAALVAYIDELRHRGQIPVRITVKPEVAAKFESIESAWQDYLLKNRIDIQHELQNGVHLPQFDQLTRNFSFLGSYITEGSRFKDIYEQLDYIEKASMKFSSELIAQGEHVLPQLLSHGITQVDESYALSQEEIKKEFDSVSERERIEFRLALRHDWTLEDELKSEAHKFEEIMLFLNRVALIKALIASAPQMK